MKYFYQKPQTYSTDYGLIYKCNHPLYKSCTLYLKNNKGLAVIQQRFDPITKMIWWGELDPWLASDLYLNDKFEDYFNKYSKETTNGVYPTVTVRKIMWALKMKPLMREFWENV